MLIMLSIRRNITSREGRWVSWDGKLSILLSKLLSVFRMLLCFGRISIKYIQKANIKIYFCSRHKKHKSYYCRNRSGLKDSSISVFSCCYGSTYKGLSVKEHWNDAWYLSTFFISSVVLNKPWSIRYDVRFRKEISFLPPPSRTFRIMEELEGTSNSFKEISPWQAPCPSDVGLELNVQGPKRTI